jgi:DNA-binding NtrC family response regulator
VAELTPQRLQALLAHDWPGNVRELRNTAERITLGLDAGSSRPVRRPRLRLRWRQPWSP